MPTPFPTIQPSEFIDLLAQGSVHDKVVEESLEIVDMRFDQSTGIYNCKFKKSVAIVQTIFEDNFLILGSEFVESLIIDGSNSFQKDLTITVSSIAELTLGKRETPLHCQNFVSIDSSSVEKLEIKLVDVPNGNFALWGNTFKGICSVSYVTAKTVGIFANGYQRESSFHFSEVDEIEVSADQPNTAGLTIEADKVGRLRISGDVKSDLTIQQTEANILEWFRSTSHVNTSVIFRDIQAHIFHLNMVISKGDLTFVNVRSKHANSLAKGLWSENSDGQTSMVILTSLRLDKATFLNFDFESFATHHLVGVAANQVSIQGHHFPSRLTPLKNPNNFIRKSIHNLYDFYIQLYTAAKNRGDRINEQRYYSAAMEYYRQELKEKNKSTYAMRIMLNLNKCTTNYGQSWLQGTLVTFGVGLVCWVAYLSFIPEVRFAIRHIDWSYTLQVVGNYFVFLNPAHRIDFEPVYTVTPWAKVVDFFSRVFISFCIYQTVAASRRLGH